MENNTKNIWKVIIAILFAAIMVVSVLAVSPDWYDNNWSKRAPITVDNMGNPDTLTDYQVKIDVAYDSDMQADFEDLRFTDSDETSELPYWIQDYTASTSATVWVKVPSIPGSSTKTIYMYYGNPSASSASNGENTFLFFDDFSGATLDTDKWDSLCDGSGTVTIVDGKLRLDSPGGVDSESKVRTKMSFGDACVENKWWLVTWPMCEDYGVVDNNRAYTSFVYGGDSIFIARMRNHYCLGERSNHYDGVSSGVYISGTYVGPHIFINLEDNPPLEGRFRLGKYGTSVRSYYDDTLILSCEDGFTTPSQLSLWIWSSFRYPPITADYDDVFVRKYTSPEPTTSVGVEEEEELLISATINIDPDTLNLNSNGKLITAYVELPEDYDVSDIDIGTVELSTENGAVSAQPTPTEVGDYDDDGIPDLMVKFDRSDVQEILEVGDEVEITVTGELTDGTVFEGSDTIRVIDKGKGK